MSEDRARNDGRASNGHVPDPGGEATDAAAAAEAVLEALDAEPLDADEAAAGAAAAADDVDETLDERVAAVIDELDGVERRAAGSFTEFAAGGRVFAALGGGRLDAALDPAVARAALRTPDVAPSPRGSAWISFTPAAVNRYALDRAEAWVRFAHGRAAGR